MVNQSEKSKKTYNELSDGDDDLDVTKIKKSWALSSGSKPLSRNTIYIGDKVPDFLMQDYVRPISKLIRPDGSIVDDSIRQKLKKSVVKEFIRLGYKLEPRSGPVKDTVTYIENVKVLIKKVPGRGYAIIINKRKAFDVDRDTLKILAFLSGKGLEVGSYNICPTYCIAKVEKEEK
jgi:hypothetical protein